ncbi:predicted protein [Chaetoceros tenuissimus]|uniref:Uncharacterized protein n=1 Tax=Chaetoceros tenuissimus TaxID=426638 RepID=A0AAD3HDK1_9STRA|nr:predicted protein [Chaetoceros tenuissimus]
MMLQQQEKVNFKTVWRYIRFFPALLILLLFSVEFCEDKVFGELSKSQTNIDQLSSQSFGIRNELTRKQTDGIPRVILATPCGGSTATMNFTKTVFEAHGYNVLNANEPFNRNNKRNKYMDIAKTKLLKRLGSEPTGKEILKETLRLYNDEAVKTNSILLFKTHNVKKYFEREMLSLNASFALMYRENILDQAICTARDCFGSVGKQVFENGTESRLCFSRRNHTDKKILAVLDPIELIKYMEERRAKNEERQSMKRLYKDSIETYERLFAFEYVDAHEEYKVFENSIDAWCNFLSNFIHVDRAIVESALIPFIDTHRKIEKHEKVIYNFETIKEHLESTEFAHYLRV